MESKRMSDMSNRIYAKRHEPAPMYLVRWIANYPYTWSALFAWLIALVIYYAS